MKKGIFRIVVLLLIVIEGISLFLPFKSFNNKDIIEDIKVSENNIIPNNKTLAIKTRPSSGGEFTDYQGSNWPGGNYKYVGADCMDNSGAKINEYNVVDFDDSKNIATIRTKDTVYCTMYFAESVSATELIETNGKTQLEDESKVTERGDVLRRFQGTAEDVKNNYICFGYNSPEDCKNKKENYLYRIIGYAINDDNNTQTKTGQIKIQKLYALEEGMQWHSSFMDNVNFDEADIHVKNLNEKYWNVEAYVPENWKSKVADHTWLLGDMLYTENAASQVGENVFKIENGQATTEYDVFLGAVSETPSQPEGSSIYKVNDSSGSPYKSQSIYYKKINTEKWTKKLTNTKVALINASDYYLSVGANTNCKTGTAKCKAGWMHLSNNDSTAPSVREWMMSRYGFGIDSAGYYALAVSETGPSSHWNLAFSYSVRPVLYLESSVTLNGSGTIDDPFIIVS